MVNSSCKLIIIHHFSVRYYSIDVLYILVLHFYPLCLIHMSYIHVPPFLCHATKTSTKTWRPFVPRTAAPWRGTTPRGVAAVAIGATRAAGRLRAWHGATGWDGGIARMDWRWLVRFISGCAFFKEFVLINDMFSNLSFVTCQVISTSYMSTIVVCQACQILPWLEIRLPSKSIKNLVAWMVHKDFNHPKWSIWTLYTNPSFKQKECGLTHSSRRVSVFFLKLIWVWCWTAAETKPFVHAERNCMENGEHLRSTGKETRHYSNAGKQYLTKLQNLEGSDITPSRVPLLASTGPWGLLPELALSIPQWWRNHDRQCVCKVTRESSITGLRLPSITAYEFLRIVLLHWHQFFPMFDLAKVLEIFIVNRFPHQRNWTDKIPKNNKFSFQKMDTQSLMTKNPCESYTFHKPRKKFPKKHPGHPTLTTLPGVAQHQKLTAKNVPKKKLPFAKTPNCQKEGRPFFLLPTVFICSLHVCFVPWKIAPLPWWIMEVPNHELEINWDWLFWALFQELSGSHKTWILRWISKFLISMFNL